MRVPWVLVIFLVAVPLAAWTYQRLGKLRDRQRFPPPGQLLSTASGTFHLNTTGKGPSVVLESGIASTSLAWAAFQETLSQEARVSSYDRLGLGWSSVPRTARTLDRLVVELDEVLAAGAVPPPYTLVGHSFGGLIVRHYAARHPEKVRGLVLVDAVNTADWMPLSESQGQRLARGVALSGRGASLAKFGVVRFALSLLESGNTHFPRLIARWSAQRGGTAVTERLAGEIRKLPSRVWPMIRMHWSDEKCFATMAEYLERLPANAKVAGDEGWPVRVPMVALTVLNTTPDFPDFVEHRLATRSGHWIQLDEPELVLQAIRDVHAKAEAQGSEPALEREPRQTE